MNVAKKIRVLYVIGGLSIGGTERQLIELVKNLDRRLYEPLICCERGGDLVVEAERLGIKVKILSKKEVSLKNPFAFLSVVRNIYNLFRDEKIDILQSCSVDIYTYIGLTLARFAGIPVIISTRRSMEHFKSRFHFLADAIVNRFTDVIIANSEAVKRDVIQKERIEADKIRIIYNGVEPGRYKVRIDKCQKKMEFGISGNCPVVGIIANLFYYKGHREFLHSAKVARKKISNVKFLIFGQDNGIKKELETLAVKLGIKRSVVFAGLRHDIPEILQIIDIQVLSSYEEGFSNVILEGMAAGKPLVVTDVGGNPEAVINGKTGIVVPPKNSDKLAEAIIKLLENPQLAQKMGEEGRKRVRENFGIGKMVSQTEDLYNELMRAKCG